MNLEYAGQVDIQKMDLACRNETFDLREFLVELNFYEDMFQNFLYGDILLSDSFNLIEKGPITGEETIKLSFVTPGKTPIKGTFSVYKISNRTIARDNNTQIFTLHFVARETLKDVINPISKVYEGNIGEVAQQIFDEYLIIDSPMIQNHAIENKIKFIPCQWSPSKTINFLASRSIPTGGVSARSTIFFQTNKQFYFSNIEHFIKKRKYFFESDKKPFTLAATNIKQTPGDKAFNIDREFRLVGDVQMVDMPDKMQQLTNGYLSNRLITFDLYNKLYEVYDYNYLEDWGSYEHTAKRKFFENATNNPAINISYYPKDKILFDEFEDNIDSVIEEIIPQRKSIMYDYTLCNLIVNVPGQTDIELGDFINFYFPELKPVNNKGEDRFDKRYTGDFLVTSIRHKVNKLNHTMILELTRDALD